MLNQHIPNPGVPGVVLHNTQHWQVTGLMGGLACEILKKERTVTPEEQEASGLSLHDCFPSVFMQGDEAAEFLAELEQAYEKLSPDKIDGLLLSAYEDVLN
jgi:hypothetical protein